jgi:hypothetical protein
MSTVTIDITSLGAKIMGALKSARKKGMTVAELVTITGENRQAVTGQLTVLKRSGVAKLSGNFRVNGSGKPSAVYISVPGVKVPKPKNATVTPRKPRAPKPVAQIVKNAPATPAAPAAPATPQTKLKNHYVLVCDTSGSMDQPSGKPNKIGAERLFNEQLDLIQKTTDQENTVTIFHFGRTETNRPGEGCIREIRYNVPPSMAPRFNKDYPAENGTPLYAAVIQAGKRAMCDTDHDKSFVMVVLTDGEENESRSRYGIVEKDLQEFIRERQATDRWTFVFLVPKGYKDKFVRQSGVHEGNVQEWDDINKAREELTAGTERYMEGRRQGRRSTKNWFTTDLSKITPADLAQLRDITDEVNAWTVEAEEEIALYVGVKTGGHLEQLKDAQGNVVLHQRGTKKGQPVMHCIGGKFAAGRGFFEIMKKEKQIQDYKKFIIIDKTTKRVYADGPTRTVRNVCGFPEKGDVAVDPGNHANFVLAAQSTSTNRLLPRGTKLYFWPGAV